VPRYDHGMNIAIIGAGNVGKTLGQGWSSKGHVVKYGSRNPEGDELSLSAAAAFGEVIVLAVPWPGAHEALRNCGDLTGKVLLDCTNPLTAELNLEIGQTTSGGEMVATWASGARVVKIFNTTGYGNMANPRYPEGAVTMIYAGDDAEAKKTAAQLAADLGFDPVDGGPLIKSRLLEPFAALWIHLAVFQGLGTNFAFRLIKR
jgi:predicted dinucleotide-binding enzyme